MTCDQCGARTDLLTECRACDPIAAEGRERWGPVLGLSGLILSGVLAGYLGVAKFRNEEYWRPLGLLVQEVVTFAGLLVVILAAVMAAVALRRSALLRISSSSVLVGSLLLSALFLGPTFLWSGESAAHYGIGPLGTTLQSGAYHSPDAVSINLVIAFPVLLLLSGASYYFGLRSGLEPLSSEQVLRLRTALEPSEVLDVACEVGPKSRPSPSWKFSKRCAVRSIDRTANTSGFEIGTRVPFLAFTVEAEAVDQTTHASAYLDVYYVERPMLGGVIPLGPRRIVGMPWLKQFLDDFTDSLRKADPLIEVEGG